MNLVEINDILRKNFPTEELLRDVLVFSEENVSMSYIPTLSIPGTFRFQSHGEELVKSDIFIQEAFSAGALMRRSEAEIIKFFTIYLNGIHNYIIKKYKIPYLIYVNKDGDFLERIPESNGLLFTIRIQKLAHIKTEEN